MLHGDVRINDHLIGEWTATRQRATEKGQFVNYDCTLVYTALDGYTYKAEWVLIGQGRQNGGISLAARVLTEGMGKAKRVYVGEGDDVRTNA